MFFHCVVPVAPLRSQPAHKSEMVSQLLFGEAVQLLETAPGGWAKVKGHDDDYEGWITQVHLTAIGMAQPLDYRYAADYINTVRVNDTPMTVPFASHIPTDALAFNSTKTSWDFTGAHTFTAAAQQGEQIVQFAYLYLNTPYLWGGKTVHGIDCSGLVQQVFKMAGMFLPRDAWQQAEKGEALFFLQEGRAGDVAFFDNAEGRIIHTGILLNEHQILHASGKVRIDSLDTEGIVNSETGVRTHHLRIVKRLI